MMLLAELRHGPSAASDIASTAMQYGHDLLLRGYTVSEVVHDYGDVCQAVTELLDTASQLAERLLAER